MHTLHWIAVEADSIKKAEESVVSQLENQENRWWDWFDTDIGGRWKDNAKTTKAQYSDECNAVFERIVNSRKDELNRCMESIDFTSIQSLVDNYKGEAVKYPESMPLWRLGNVAKLLSGDDYFSDSYFYDLEEWSTELNPLRERMANAQTKDRQYLVPIDFHF